MAAASPRGSSLDAVLGIWTHMCRGTETEVCNRAPRFFTAEKKFFKVILKSEKKLLPLLRKASVSEDQLSDTDSSSS